MATPKSSTSAICILLAVPASFREGTANSIPSRKWSFWASPSLSLQQSHWLALAYWLGCGIATSPKVINTDNLILRRTVGRPPAVFSCAGAEEIHFTAIH